MKFYNELYDPDFNREMYSGVKGVDWDYDANGVPYMFPETLKKIADKDESFIGAGYHSRDPYLTAYNPSCLHPDGYPLDLLEISTARADSQNYLWLIDGKGNLWRGRLNRLGWAKDKTYFGE